MFFKLKPIIVTCSIAIAFCLQTQTGFGQAKVQDISKELWSKLPKGYDFYDCGFGPNIGNQTFSWNCVMESASEKGSKTSVPFFWHLAINEKGNLGNGLIGRYPGVPPFAFGSKTTLLVQNDNGAVSALDLPASSTAQVVQLHPLWQYVIPKNDIPEIHLSVSHTVSTNDGGYVLLIEDMSKAAAENTRDDFTVVQVTDQGKEAWRYDHITPLPRGFTVGDLNHKGRLFKDFFITSNHKTVLYGQAFEAADSKGTFVVCLDSKGQKISEEFFPDSHWTQSFNWDDKGFGFVSIVYDETTSTDVPTLNLFDKNCQKLLDQPFNISKHGFKGSVYNEIIATGLSSKGDLLLVYNQHEHLPEGTDADAPPPNLYLTVINSKGGVAQDIAILKGQDADKLYLESFTSVAGHNPLKVTLANLPQSNEVLISIYNMGTDPKAYPEEKADFWLPRIYKVKLP